jgi:hypothetical protein
MTLDEFVRRNPWAHKMNEGKPRVGKPWWEDLHDYTVHCDKLATDGGYLYFRPTTKPVWDFEFVLFEDDEDETRAWCPAWNELLEQ